MVRVMFKVSTKDIDKNKKDGIVYVLDIDVDGKQLVKIGITGRKIEDRVVEILTSHFHAYREFPRCRPKRYRKTTEMYVKEQMLLNYFSGYKYDTEKKFGGCQELVDVPLDVVVSYYERVLDGEILEGRYEGDSGGSRNGRETGEAGEGRDTVGDVHDSCGVDVPRERVEADEIPEEGGRKPKKKPKKKT